MAVGRVGELLVFFGRQREPAGVTEVAQALGMPVSTVSRIAGALAELGFLQRSTDGERYILGLVPVILGRAALRQRSLDIIARPSLERLMRETDEGVSLSTLHEDRIVYLMYVPSNEPLSFNVAPGQTFPAHTSAMGKVLLAWMEPDRLNALLAHIVLTPKTPRSITSPAVLVDQLAEVVQSGFAIDDEETLLGIRCVAAPVWDETGHAVAAVSVSGLASRVTYERVPAVAKAVRDAAFEISLQLGYSSNGPG